MAHVPLDRQFAGQSRLVRLLLWKIGDSTDVEACLDAAIEQGMIGEDDGAFLAACMQVEESMRPGNPAANATDIPAIEMDADTIARLRRCADKLNRADSA